MSAPVGCGYLLAHLRTVGIGIDHPAALWLLALLPVFFFAARRDFRRWRAALAARAGAFVCLVFALAGLLLTARLPDNRLSLIAAVDVSQSIDATGRRWEQRYLDQVAAALAPGDELGVVAFAADARVLHAPGAAAQVELQHAAVSSTATDIGRGLEAAMALLAPDAAHRVLLLTDGNETRGDAVAKLAQARRAAATIFAAVPPHADGVDVALEKLVVPPLVAAGSVFPVRVVLRNPPPSRPAVLGFAVDGEATGDVRLVLQPGVNAVEVPYRMTGAGGHRLRVQVSVAGDTVAGNDYREAPVTVGGKPRLLLVSAQPHAALASALSAKGISVTTVPPVEFPQRLNALLGYQCVVFEDVAARSVNARALDALERYVRNFGGGFIAAAGARTFGDGGFKRTALARLLPVTIEPHRPPHAEREPLALFILIDRSNSMGYSIRNRLQRSETESKLAYAKRAALAVVTQLRDTDLVGLIVFDSEPFEVAPLRPLKENRALLTTDIPRLQPGGGTDFYDALDSARRQLIASGATTKHVMLLTDGDTNRGAADHYPLIAELAKADISVSTIRIGDDAVNLKLLTDISARTGGQFHHVEHLETLPALLLRDTSQAMARAGGADEHFVPHIAAVSQVLRGLTSQALPAVDDYAYTRLKPGADLLLSVQSRHVPDPLLGVWRYGLGRVAAFTASLAGGAAGWVRWEGFEKMWSQLVRWTMRDETAWDYALAVRRTAGQTTLRVQAFDDLDGGVLMARLFPDPDHPVDVPLVPRGPRLFTGRLPSLPGGHYPLMIIKRGADHVVRERTELIAVPRRDEEPQEEFEARGPNLALLRALTAGTGGALNAPASAVAGRQPGSRQARRSLDWLFIPAAMGLLLVDVGLRRLAIPA